MRGRCLLLVMILLPIASGQALPERLLGEDDADDVELFLPDGTSLGATDQFPHLDVLGAEVFKADSGDMAFTIRLKDTSYANRGDESSDLSTSIALHFFFGTIHYYVDYGDWRRDGGDACLTRYIDGDRIDPIQCFPTASTGQEIRVDIPGSYVTDESGARLRHPAQLTEVWAQGRMDTRVEPLGHVQAIDTAPDEGTWGSLVTPADLDAGPLILTPIQPVRGSNGGPDLIVYHILVDNIDDETITATPSIHDLPETWEATVPGQITVEPLGTYDLPVLVRIPTAHAHGTQHEFTVTVETDEASWSETLGLNFFEIPQPAGHHPRMYLHGFTGNGFTAAWISTQADDDLADGTADDGWGSDNDPTTNTANRLFFLNSRPDLLIGLDFDTRQAVQAELTLSSDLAVPADLRVALEHCNPTDASHRSYAEYGGDLRCPGSWIALAEAERSVDLDAGANRLDLELEVTDYADLVPPQAGALLGLMIEVSQPLSTEPISNIRLETDGTLDLPLLEYRDPLDEGLSSLAGLSLAGDAELVLGPGSTAWRTWTIHNEGPARDLDLSVFGHNADWIRLEPMHVPVPADGTAEFQVGITAGDGHADVFLLAVDRDDPSQNWAHPLRVETDPTAPAVHESGPAKPGQDAPLPVSLPLLALAALAFARRGKTRD